ncbi:scavenger receptor cysteine-rich domain-containing protein DMBT1-like [Amphiura filiformis]|uniref:scavenger receptor cysteine-rich domain-containing protein DMBT1-like n=1 Tax=Amphiura filiformis TaxID=82378 RepID=UPI003B212FC2
MHRRANSISYCRWKQFFRGRVELLVSNIWGTVCDNSWDAKDAKVICQQLGLPHASPAALKGAFFGPGYVVIWMDNVGCYGTESSLGQCSHGGLGVSASTCAHSRDAGVICTDGPTQYRIVSGSNSNEGRVELLVSNIWGTVCDNSWDAKDAKVICQQLGLPHASPAALKDAFFGHGYGVIWMDNVGCYGTESSLGQCSHNGLGVSASTCTHSRDAGVICTDGPTQYRLVGGTNNTEGRVELLLGNRWGTVCDDSWDANDARVICRHLGLPHALPVALKSAYFGQGSGIIWMDNVECYGTESSLDKCRHAGMGVHNCGHSKDAGVICTDGPIQYRLVGGANNTEGRVELLLGNRWGTVCDDSWDANDARVICRHLGLPHASPVALKAAYFGQGNGIIWMDNVACYGTESSLDKCRHAGMGVHNCGHSKDAGVICTDGPTQYRLVEGNTTSEGRVELYLGDRWGTVCDDYWGSNDAKVICRQLGLPHEAATALTNAYFGQGSGFIWMDNVACIGIESTLDQCGNRGWGVHDCRHNQDAGVICANGPAQYRLVGGSGSNEGRVEVGVGSVWGTVCGYGAAWDVNDAKVICRHLELPHGSPEAISNAFFGQGTGPILMDNVGCTGMEMSLDRCTHRGWGVYDQLCGHSHDVGVICSDGAITGTETYQTKGAITGTETYQTKGAITGTESTYQTKGKTTTSELYPTKGKTTTSELYPTKEMTTSTTEETRGCLPFTKPIDDSTLFPMKDWYDEGDMVLIICSQGFNLIGDQVVICGSTSSWQGQIPKCSPSQQGGVVIHDIVCEGMTFYFECASGQTISTQSALYGRQSSDVCTDQPFDTVNCAAADSLAVVQQRCDGRQTCDIPSSDNIFGDPCYGTYKYLEIQYTCQEMTTSTTEETPDRWNLIVGISAGGVFLFFVLAIVIVVVRKRGNRTDLRPPQNPAVEDNARLRPNEVPLSSISYVDMAANIPRHSYENVPETST